MLICNDTCNKYDKKDNPADNDMGPILSHTRAEIIGQDKNDGMLE